MGFFCGGLFDEFWSTVIVVVKQYTVAFNKESALVPSSIFFLTVKTIQTVPFNIQPRAHDVKYIVDAALVSSQ